MKKYIILCVTLLIANAGFSQSKDYARVEAAVEKLKLAMISGVREDLASIVDDSLSYGHSGGAVEGKAEFVEKIASGKSDFVTINLTDQKISITG
ncbi:MAG: nuclear transport factor 2 family protein, partial [Sediminibacterium sp.]|nr:nuclear transport factor 2 family protein [Sediminibacterium sp.]